MVSWIWMYEQLRVISRHQIYLSRAFYLDAEGSSFGLQQYDTRLQRTLSSIVEMWKVSAQQSQGSPVTDLTDTGVLSAGMEVRRGKKWPFQEVVNWAVAQHLFGHGGNSPRPGFKTPQHLPTAMPGGDKATAHQCGQKKWKFALAGRWARASNHTGPTGSTLLVGVSGELNCGNRSVSKWFPIHFNLFTCIVCAMTRSYRQQRPFVQRARKGCFHRQQVAAPGQPWKTDVPPGHDDINSG